MNRSKAKYVPKKSTKQEFLELLYNKEGMTSQRARNLVFYGVPMSLVRWANYLTTDEMDLYLELFDATIDTKVEEVDF